MPHEGGCQCDECEKEVLTTEYNLFTKINDSKFSCLGEEVPGSGRKVFKPYADRNDETDYVNTDCDPEIIFNIPFHGNVKLKSFIIKGGEGNHPTKVLLFKNKLSMTFDDCQRKQPDQVFELAYDPQAKGQYNVKATKFNGTHHLTMFFPDSADGEETKIYYIGLRGEFDKVNRDEIVICNYEIAANPADLESKAFQTNTTRLGQ